MNLKQKDFRIMKQDVSVFESDRYQVRWSNGDYPPYLQINYYIDFKKKTWEYEKRMDFRVQLFPDGSIYYDTRFSSYGLSYNNANIVENFFKEWFENDEGMRQVFLDGIARELKEDKRGELKKWRLKFLQTDIMAKIKDGSAFRKEMY